MKKQLSLLICLCCNLVQSNAERIPFTNLESNPNYSYIFHTIIRMIAGGRSINLLIDSIDLPSISLDKAYEGNITLYKQNGQACPPGAQIPYRHVKYDSLTSFEQHIFDYYNFDKDKFVTIVGFVPRAYDWRCEEGEAIINLMNGSLTMDSITVYLRWVLDTDKNKELKHPIYNKLVLCANAKFKSTNYFTNGIFYWE